MDKTYERGQAQLDEIPMGPVAGPQNEKAKKATVKPDKHDSKKKKSAAVEKPESPFQEIKPSDEKVDPAQLLTEIARNIRRFIFCKPETANAAALWVAMTWFMEVVQVAPLAVITAPEKRCGKTQLLTVMSRLSCRPLTASNITPAALFRSIDAWSPTLFIDEADAFMRDNEELRGLINCGHTRDSAYIVRTVGTEFTPKMFNVWSAKAISGIGHLADTLMDRAIVLELRRKLPTESVERLRYAGVDLWMTLASKLARFAQDSSDSVKEARPLLPDELNDRAQDNWEPLLQIAQVAGGEWPRLAQLAARSLSSDSKQPKTVGIELLFDIQQAFEAGKVDRFSSVDLIAILTADDEKMWSGYNRGFPIRPAQVAKQLREYGISVNTIRIHETTKKGYLQSDFADVFNRYLSADPLKPELAVTPSQANIVAGPPVTHVLPVTAKGVTGNTKVTLKPSTGAGCDGVTGKSTDTADYEAEDAL